MATRSEQSESQKDDKTQLYELVEELTTSGESNLNEKLMKKLKNLCKRSDDNLNDVHRIVLNQMEKEHAEIRLSCFQIINELFLRSHGFRQMILADFHNLLELCVETNDERKLPPPKNVARTLKSTALSDIESWHQKFGKHYKKLEIGYDFLKRVKQIDFAGVRSRTLLERQRQESLEARQRDLEKRAVEKVRNEIKENGIDIESATKQGNSCLNLVLPRPCDFYPEENSDLISETSPEVIVDSACGENRAPDDMADSMEKPDNDHVGKYHGIPTKDYKLTIRIPFGKTIVVETDDNKDILANLHDLLNEIKNKYLPMVNRWINILSKCSNVNDELEKCVQFKDSMKELTEKYNEIEIKQHPVPGSSRQLENGDGNDDDYDDSDDDGDNEMFEDVPEIEGVNFGTGVENWTANEEALKNFDEQKNAADFMKCNEKDRLEKLKKIAPVLPFDNDLKYWESKKLHITPITKNDSLHKFWSHGEVNEDFIPDSLEASLRSRTIVFAGEFKKVKWKCRAPMANGQLCERQDRLKCPFHGKIIPRDEFGLPSNPDDILAESERKHKLAEDEINNICKDVEVAIGKDLGCGKKRKKPDIRKQRYSRLTNLKTVTNTSRKRLESKVLQKGALRRVDEALTAIEKRRNLERFGSNFNYHYEY